MADIYDREDERRELRKLIEHYEKRAEHYEYEYKVNGIPSQEKAWMRNERMADALRAALDGKDMLGELHDLRFRILALDTGDPDALVKQVEYLQKRIEGGGA